MFSIQLNYSWHVLHTMELLMTCAPYNWTTHDIFSVHVTKLTNFSRFHVLRIQKPDYRLHFTCGRVLYFLKHYKHTARCVNTVRKKESTNSACMHTIVTAALQQQYSQTELIFRISLVLIDIFNIILTGVILKYAYVCVCMFIYMCVCVCVCVCMYVCMYVCVYVCVCVCVCVYICVYVYFP